MEKRNEYLFAITKFIVRVWFAYGLCLLFTVEFNPLLWGTAAKVWLIILVVLLLSND